MEGNSLFNPGFLGGNFSWWVGQVADDSVWRDNIIPTVHSDKNMNPGWGYRYKVRILGIHDWGEESIASEDLPWAQVMYPITAGGGQGAAYQTPAIRQGNMVMGFFMDQQDQQIPVIMGVLGNNQQQPKSTTIGDNRVTNAKSGAIGTGSIGTKQQKQTKELLKQNSPDDNLQTTEPSDSSSAVTEATDGIHTGNVDDAKKSREEKIKIVMLSPCNPPTSAMKGIQTALDNLINYIDGWLSTITSYIDAASAIINSLKDMESKLEMIACEIAKYMKILMDKMMEYTLKMLNKALTNAVSSIPSTMRSMFGDIKEMITELILCLYNKLTDSMCKMIADLLKSAFPLEELEAQAKEAAANDEINSNNRTSPQVPMCYAEDLVGQIVGMHKVQIEDANQSIFNNISTFIMDIQEEMAGVTDAFAEIKEPISDIMGSISQVLGFENLKLNILGCELTPNCPISDYYTLGSGGSSQSDAEAVSNASVEKSVANSTGGDGAAGGGGKFAQPTSSQTDTLTRSS